MANGDLDPLYKDRPVTLWVEDPLTRDYLKEGWDDPQQVRLLVAGNNQAVHSLVGSARREGYTAVFGLCDRDFGATNHGSWSTTTSVFRLRMHEIENAILHPDSLSAALQELGTSVHHSTIEGRLLQEANSFVWGMALGATLRWLRDTLQEDFPHSNGLVGVGNQTAAEQRIFGSLWWQAWQASLPTSITEISVQGQLSTRHGYYAKHLGSPAYLEEFAGKELLGRVFSWLTTGCGKPITHQDLTKTVGRVQRQQGWLPAEIAALHSILMTAAK